MQYDIVMRNNVMQYVMRNYDMQSRHIEAMQARETAVWLISVEAISLCDILKIVWYPKNCLIS